MGLLIGYFSGHLEHKCKSRKLFEPTMTIDAAEELTGIPLLVAKHTFVSNIAPSTTLLHTLVPGQGKVLWCVRL
jgi:hypothetical protein